MSESSTSSATGRPPRTVRRRRRPFRRVLLVILVVVAALVATAALVPTTRWATASGYVMTERETEIRPSVEGAIKRWLVKDGDEVKKGQLLIQLDDSVQQAACKLAQWERKAAEAKLARLRSMQELEQAQRRKHIFQAERKLAMATDSLKKMQEASSGGFSPQEIREAKLAVEVASSQLSELKLSHDEVLANQIAVLQEDIKTAREKVALHTAEAEQREIRAAQNGTIRLNRFEPGEVVKPDHVLGQVFDGSAWSVRLKLPEHHIRYVKEGQHVNVELAAYPSWRHGYVKATVSKVVPVVSPQATGDGIFQVYARIDDPDNSRLHPGMSARAHIATGTTNWLFRLISW